MSWYKRSQYIQDVYPTKDNFMVNLRGKTKAIDSSRKNAINKELHALGSYFKDIPLDEIFGILKSHDVWPIQEDGTPWSGFVTVQGECGSEKATQSPMMFDLAVKGQLGYLPSRNKLIMTACTMPSGTIEIVVYVS